MNAFALSSQGALLKKDGLLDHLTKRGANLLQLSVDCQERKENENESMRYQQHRLFSQHNSHGVSTLLQLVATVM